MQPLKSVFGLVGALLPVAYCGGLVWFFQGQTGGVEFITSAGLGPTVIGLGALGVLFCIPLILKLTKIVTAPAKPVKVTGIPDAPESEFDADAALARYLARKAAGEIEVPVAAPVQRASFGRKIG